MTDEGELSDEPVVMAFLGLLQLNWVQLNAHITFYEERWKA